MTELTDAELEDIAREAASGVEGLGKVERVKVSTALDSDHRLVYDFYYMIDQGSDRRLPGKSYGLLGRRLRDALIDRHDHRYPHVTILDAADWKKVHGASAG